MSEFAPTTFIATIDALRDGVSELSAVLKRIGPAVLDATSSPLMPPFVKQGLVWCGEQMLEMGTAVVDRVLELMAGVHAPLSFFSRASAWHETVGGPSSRVAGSVHPNALRATLEWSGEAASRYSDAVAGQTVAASGVQSVSSGVAGALTKCAVAGLAFYAALGAIVGQILSGIVGALAAMETVALSWAGVAAFVTNIGINSAMIAAAVAAVVALVGAQADAIVQLSSTETSGAAFPGGAWPVGTP